MSLKSDNPKATSSRPGEVLGQFLSCFVFFCFTDFDNGGYILYKITGVMVSHKTFYGPCPGGVGVGFYRGKPRKAACIQETYALGGLFVLCVFWSLLRHMVA